MIDFKSASIKNLLLAAIHSKGYKEDANKTTKRHRVFKDGFGDTVIVSAGTNFQLYYNPEISDDKGDVIRFLLNRAGIGINCGNSLKTYYKQIESELENLGFYALPNLPPCPSTSATIEIKPFNWGHYQSFVSNFGDHIPDSIQALLLQRCIPVSVLFDPVLQPVQQFRNGETGYCNIFFPFRDKDGNIVGGQYKYLRNNGKDFETVKMNLPNSERERSLWYTSDAGKDSLFVVEDPFDAISYQVLHHRKDNMQYAATGGNITGNQIIFIRKMATQKRLILGNDLDFAGMFANLSIIEGKPVNKKVDKNRIATFKIDGEEFSLDFSNLIEFVKERAKKNNIEVVIPVSDDWNEELRQEKRKPSSKLTDITKNSDTHAGKVTQGTGIYKHI
jgi:hypothetical protein